MGAAVRDTDAIEKHTLIYPSLYIDCTQFEASTQNPDDRKNRQKKYLRVVYDLTRRGARARPAINEYISF